MNRYSITDEMKEYLLERRRIIKQELSFIEKAIGLDSTEWQLKKEVAGLRAKLLEYEGASV